MDQLIEYMSHVANEQLTMRIGEMTQEKEHSYQRIKKQYQEKFKLVMDRLDSEFEKARIGSQPLKKIREKITVTEKAD